MVQTVTTDDYASELDDYPDRKQLERISPLLGRRTTQAHKRKLLRHLRHPLVLLLPQDTFLSRPPDEKLVVVRSGPCAPVSSGAKGASHHTRRRRGPSGGARGRHEEDGWRRCVEIHSGTPPLGAYPHATL